MPVKISQRTSMPGVHAASQAVSTRVLDDIEDRLGNVDEAEIPVVTQENRLMNSALDHAIASYHSSISFLTPFFSFPAILSSETSGSAIG